LTIAACRHQVASAKLKWHQVAYWTNVTVLARARSSVLTLTSANLDRGLNLFPALQPRLSEAAANLSGGQMLAIGRALMNSPRLLISTSRSSDSSANREPSLCRASRTEEGWAGDPIGLTDCRQSVGTR
jgi:hypothetical protein